jgi:hypothetical protein
VSNLNLSPAERHILEQMGGRPWQARQRTDAAVEAARAEWKAVHTAVGFATSALLTTERTNPKMGKIGLPALGLTIHSATNALIAWFKAGDEIRHDLAVAVGVAEADIDDVLRLTVCPRSTKGCVGGCVTSKSANAKLDRSQRSRLARHIFLMFRPAAAFTLMGDQLKAARDLHGRRGARWRVNVSDDLRMELLAPGLFSLAPRPYSYTKWSPEERPGRPGFRLVYSASERTSPQTIADWCQAGHRVAVVMDVKRGKAIPDSFLHLPVVDGDLTDDLWAHPAGAIVGLRAKGTKDARAAMLKSRFTKRVGLELVQDVLVPQTGTLPAAASGLEVVAA